MAQQHFFMFVVTYSSRLSTSEFYDSICSLLRHCTSFFRQEVNFSCIKQALLLMGDEKKRKEKAFLCLFLLAVHWQEELQKPEAMLRFSPQSPRLLSVCSDKSPSARTTRAHTHSQISAPMCVRHTSTLYHAISYLPITAD